MYTHKDTCTHTTACTYVHMHAHGHAYTTPHTNKERRETLVYVTLWKNAEDLMLSGKYLS